MKKYQLHSLRPKIEGFAYPEPTKEEMKKILEDAGLTGNGEDEAIGLYVVCDRKPEDFPQYGLWWVEVDDLVQTKI
ncbi:hypothetical protein NDS46_30485 (plasmid) [Paenibacillus thiaminolyticus]|uniref:hypothetical protein n=1 Tax=Paenibacillus thiaminolyticus TaxID=49283 RepID=UPI00232D6C7F|nr:hypothetical protein [Paenibacillus thiaminolyticus]WCF11677.1 hypothetical protein NDS46_30485 [Paenibacillus thiaminolyticus]